LNPVESIQNAWTFFAQSIFQYDLLLILFKKSQFDYFYFSFLKNNDKKAKSFSLAPIEVEILISRGSAYKIVAESGTIIPKNAKSFCSKINN
jgi:hypothetical protein